MANTVLYGLWAQGDLSATTPASVLDPNMLITTVTETVASHNAEIDAMLGLFCEETTSFQERYVGGFTGFHQPMDEHGDPLPFKPAGEYTTGYALKMGGSRYGYNFVTREKMTAIEFDRSIGQVLLADVNWVRRHLLAALLTRDSWTFKDPIEGDLTIRSLANGDTVTYGLTTSDALATDDHYSYQISAISSTDNPLPAIQAELEEHPDNSGPFILFVRSGSTNATNIKALAAFVEDPAAQLATMAPQTTADRLTTTLGVNLPRTAKMVGVYGNLWIVEWGAIPDGYLLTVAVGGPKPLKRRQDKEASLQGLFNPVGERLDQYPYFSNRWFRRTGFGGWGRLSAHVHYVGAAPYAAPLGFSYNLLG